MVLFCLFWAGIGAVLAMAVIGYFQTSGKKNQNADAAKIDAALSSVQPVRSLDVTQVDTLLSQIGAMGPPDLTINQYAAEVEHCSLRQHGTGYMTHDVCASIQYAVERVKTDLRNISNYADIIELAVDGATRAGHLPSVISRELSDRNKSRLKEVGLLGSTGTEQPM